MIGVRDDLDSHAMSDRKQIGAVGAMTLNQTARERAVESKNLVACTVADRDKHTFSNFHESPEIERGGRCGAQAVRVNCPLLIPAAREIRR